MHTNKDIANSASSVTRYIIWLRDEKVILDFHLAQLYEVETRSLIQAVKRNAERFPNDFMFQLTEKEENFLRSQNVISKIVQRGGRRYRAHAFTEQGVAMLSSVLRSQRAIRVNIQLIRSFVKLREILESDKYLKQKLNQLEQKYDEQFKVVFEAIRQLMEPPKTDMQRPIGFAPWPEETMKG